MAHPGDNNEIGTPTAEVHHLPRRPSGNVIGPVAMQRASVRWAAPWGEKQLIYAIGNFIDVGGKLDADAPDQKRR